MELAAQHQNAKRIVYALVGVCLLGIILVQVVKRFSGSTKAAITAPAPDDPPEVAEQKAREAVTQFFDAIFSRDPETALKLVDAPWYWDGDKHAEGGESRAAGSIRDRRDLDRRLTRGVLQVNVPRNGDLSHKTTGARRWSLLNHAIPWDTDSESIQLRNKRSATYGSLVF